MSNIACPPPWLSYFSVPLAVDTDFLITIGIKKSHIFSFLSWNYIWPELFLFFSFLLNFKGVFWGVKITGFLLVAVGILNRGDLIVGPRDLLQPFWLFLYFFPCLSLRLIHPYRLSNNLRSDIVRYKFKFPFESEPVGAGFFISPLYTISFCRFCQAVRQLDQTSGRFRFRRLPTLVRQIKSKG